MRTVKKNRSSVDVTADWSWGPPELVVTLEITPDASVTEIRFASPNTYLTETNARGEWKGERTKGRKLFIRKVFTIREVQHDSTSAYIYTLCTS